MNEDPSVETVARIAAAHRHFGTTGLMPTLVTDAPEATPAAIAAVRESRERLPAVLGIHLEGPFIDPDRRGAHEPRFIRQIVEADVTALSHAGCGAVMITIAPNRCQREIERRQERLSGVARAARPVRGSDGVWRQSGCACPIGSGGYGFFLCQGLGVKERLHGGVRRERRRFPVGASPTRRNAPAGSNRSSHGGDEMAEAFGVAGHV